MSASTLPALVSEPRHTRALRLLPGVALAALVGVAAYFLAAIETRAFGHPVIEGLVVAILLGMAVRTMWVPSDSIDAGVRFTATQVLEVAVFLLGASVDLPLLVRAGPALALGIVLLVILGITFSYGIGRVVGLPHKLAVLVACGNSICGNSAIAAVAPVIRADKEHVASSIAFTAILGVVVVIGLPFLMHPLKLSFYQYGVLAGLTVYSVPQVLAAAFPVSALSGQVGTLVKLVRVLMLGPVVLFFALKHRHDVGANDSKAAGFRLTRFVPWFIIGFLGLAAARSGGAIPASAADAMKSASTWLTVAAMAALGLGVDLKAIRKVGLPVIVTVTVSLAVLIALSVTLLRVLSIK
ncbi:MAG TPA: putative sulfate exporter family transporter [Gemmatimonadaceae bacterium]|nr:putative sulfate exporter family transporter [Gemmatimonadaceae bacterium]